MKQLVKSKAKSFYLKCPDCDDCQSRVFDESYWHQRYRLDWHAQYERHYQREHAPIPLPEVIEV